MTMKCPLVVKSPGDIAAMSTAPASSLSFIVFLSTTIVSLRRPSSAAPAVNSDQAVPASMT